MPLIPALDLDLRRIEQFCADQTPGHVRDHVVWEAHVRGDRPDVGNWTLHWADRNSRWHVYDAHGRAMVGSCAALLAEIDADPTAIFKG